MIKKTYGTPSGTIHYWISDNINRNDISLIFLSGLTADHRLFDKQIVFFEKNEAANCKYLINLEFGRRKCILSN